MTFIADNGRTTPAGSDILGVMQAVVSPVLAYIGPGAGFTFLSSFFVLFTAIALLFLSLVTWPIHFVLQWFHRLRAGVRSGVKRVVVVGLDPQRTRRLIECNRLPHFRKLREHATLTDLKTTLPPISPVAWSSFMIGVNPGKHNIFDFLNRNLRSCLPELSSAKVVTAGSRHRHVPGKLLIIKSSPTHVGMGTVRASCQIDLYFAV